MALAPDTNIKPPVPQQAWHSILDFVVTDADGYDPNTLGGQPSDRWQGGFGVLDEPCTQPGYFRPCSTGDDRKKVVEPEDRDYGNRYDPFIAYVPYSCTAAGFDRDGYEDRVLTLLQTGFAKAIEAEFWDELNSSPTTSVNGVLTGSPAPLSPMLALASLSQGLADCANGALGVLHVPAGIGQLWVQGGMVEEDAEGRLRTVGRGDYVIIGSGYDIESPIVAYATGLIEVRMGKPFVTPDTFSEAFDRATNTVTVYGETVAAVSQTGCCILSVDIDPS